MRESNHYICGCKTFGGDDPPKDIEEVYSREVQWQLAWLICMLLHSSMSIRRTNFTTWNGVSTLQDFGVSPLDAYADDHIISRDTFINKVRNKVWPGK